MNSIGRIAVLLLLVTLAGCSSASLGSGLMSNPNIGLSPQMHEFGNVNVRTFTQAPLGAEVKVFLPIPPDEAMAIVYNFQDYPSWVAPPPKRVTIDNSHSATGEFGVGSKISYEEGQTDVVEYLDKSAAMITRPLWASADLKGHRGVVVIQPHNEGSLMHMRRYFEVASVKGFLMSRAMPGYMKTSAENLAKLYDGRLH